MGCRYFTNERGCVMEKQKKWWTPNVLTTLRIVATLPMVIFYLIDQNWARWVTLIIFVIVALTDFADGGWARVTKQVTVLGKILDPVADKILVYGILACFCSKLPWFVIVFMIIVIRDFVVDGVRADSACKGKVMAASATGKRKTATQMTAIVLILVYRILWCGPTAICVEIAYGIWWLGIGLFALSVVFCLVSGYEYLQNAGYDYLGSWLKKRFSALKRKKSGPQ